MNINDSAIRLTDMKRAGNEIWSLRRNIEYTRRKLFASDSAMVCCIRPWEI